MAFLSLQKHMEKNQSANLRIHLADHGPCLCVGRLGISGDRRNPRPTQLSGTVLVGVHLFDNVY